jgi:hypothetical protein
MDYCINYTLPQNNPGLEKGDQIIRFSTTEKNPNNQLYAWPNLTNTYVMVYNNTHANNATFDFYLADETGDNPTGTKYYYFERRTCLSGCDGAPAYAIICLNGTDTVWYDRAFASHAVAKPLCRETTLTLSDFDKVYRRNWTFKNLNDNSLTNFTGTKTDLKVWCPTTTEATLNLTNLVGDGGSHYSEMKEHPKYYIDSDTYLRNVREDDDQNVWDDFYLSTTTSATEYTFKLYDYSGGDFYRSELQIEQTINDAQAIVNLEKFGQDNNLVKVPLINGSTYKIIVDGTSVRDIGPILMTDDTTRGVIISRPDVSDFANNWQGLTIGITKSYDTSAVGCTINNSVSGTGNFTVSNVSGQLYASSSTGSNIGFTYTVPVADSTYTIFCSMTDTTYGTRSKLQVINLRNESAIHAGFDLDIPTTIVGLSRSFVYQFSAMAITVLVGGLFSAGSVGTGAVVFAAMFGMFNWVGWMGQPTWMVGFIGALALFIKYSERRQGLAT